MLFLGYLISFAIIFAIPFLIWRSIKRNYEESQYAKVTGYSYWSVMRDKGRLGEARLAKQIYRFDPAANILFNIFIPLANGKTTEIDAVYIASWGIVVFENKNYSGWIFGRESDPQWTQTLNKRTKNRFYNPIKQNESHIKALSEYLALPIDDFNSVIVFSDEASFKKLDIGYNMVIHTSDVFRYLGYIRDVSEVIFNDDAVKNILEKLRSCTNVSNEIKEQHIQNIQNNH